MGKVIIMSTRPQSPVPGGAPSEREGPISASEIRAVHTAVDIQRTLGRMEHAVEVLENTTKAHGEKLEKLHQIDRAQFELVVLENAVALHGDRIRGLEKVAHFAEFVGAIMVGGGILYIARVLAPLFSK